MSLVVELDEGLEDHACPRRRGPRPARSPTPAATSPRFAGHGLPLAGRGHDRLDHARQAERVERRRAISSAVAEAVRRGREPELLGGQAADPLAVHRQPRGARRRDDLSRRASSNSAARRSRSPRSPGTTISRAHGRSRSSTGASRAARLGSVIVEHVTAVRDGHRRGAGVAVAGDDLAARGGSPRSRPRARARRSRAGSMRVRRHARCAGVPTHASRLGRWIKQVEVPCATSLPALSVRDFCLGRRHARTGSERACPPRVARHESRVIARVRLTLVSTFRSRCRRQRRLHRAAGHGVDQDHRVAAVNACRSGCRRDRSAVPRRRRGPCSASTILNSMSWPIGGARVLAVDDRLKKLESREVRGAWRAVRRSAVSNSTLICRLGMAMRVRYADCAERQRNSPASPRRPTKSLLLGVGADVTARAR